MIEHLTTSALVTEAMLHVLQSRGIDGEPVARDCGIEPRAIHDPQARVPLAVVRRMWRKSVTRTQDPCIGFEVGFAIRPTHLHAVGYAWLASRTLREALDRLALLPAHLRRRAHRVDHGR